MQLIFLNYCFLFTFIPTVHTYGAHNSESGVLCWILHYKTGHVILSPMAGYLRTSYNLLQSLQQCFSFFFISWFSEQCEHVLLVALYARLVERIHAE